MRQKEETPSHRVLRKYWGYEHFRDPQEAIIETVLSGQDCFALMPTGGGKSICYQLPAVMMEGTTLVISPLIALMKDQVDGLESRGISAKAIHSGMNRDEIEAVLVRALNGRLNVLYVSPERIHTTLFKSYAEDMDISLVAVDEAHCISQWGYDFRPSYLEIQSLREYTDAPFLALTGSADDRVIEDIIDHLGFRDKYKIFKKSFVRENICYRIVRTEQKLKTLSETYRSGFSAITYAGTRGLTEKISHFLKYRNIASDFYHAGLDTKSRTQKQQNWISEHPPLIVSTNAFGMGIDKPNVRQVFHTSPPSSPEAYYQEAGRAGRDEKFATATLFVSDDDPSKLDRLLEIRHFSAEEARQMYESLHSTLDIAIGSGAGHHFELDLLEFSNKIELNIQKVLNFLKFFEREGYWVFSEQNWDARPVARVKGGPESLHYLKENHLEKPRLVLEALFRLYQDIRHADTRIVIPHIAQKIDMSTEHVSRHLKSLERMGLIYYRIPAEGPSLHLLQDRVPIEELHFDLQRLEYLRKKEEQKIAQMKSYLMNDSICRQKFLISFFGEDVQQDCGICDVCRDSSRPDINKDILCTFVRSIENPHIQNVQEKFFSQKKGDFLNWMRLGTQLGWWEIKKNGEMKLLK